MKFKRKKYAPMAAFPVTKGQEVVVLSGAHRGKRGKILSVQRGTQRVLIEGVNMIKKAMRKSQAHPQGGIGEREGSLHVSNIMSAERYDARRGKSRSQNKGEKTAKASN